MYSIAPRLSCCSIGISYKNFSRPKRDLSRSALPHWALPSCPQDAQKSAAQFQPLLLPPAPTPGLVFPCSCNHPSLPPSLVREEWQSSFPEIPAPCLSTGPQSRMPSSALKQKSPHQRGADPRLRRCP